MAFRPRGWDEKPACTAKCLKNGVIGMYGPPLCRKRKVRIAGVVCAYVYGLVGVF